MGEITGLDFVFSAARASLLLCAFAAFAWALLRMRRESAEQGERLQALQASQRDLLMQTHVLSERVAALATIVASQPRRQEPLVAEPPPPPKLRRDSGMRSYETAKRMARSGASIQEIVASCGVADTEARLLRRLHGADSQRDNAA